MILNTHTRLFLRLAACTALTVLTVLTTLTGCGDDAIIDAPKTDLPTLSETPHFAVVSAADATSIAMLDANGDILDAMWFTSGSTFPGLVASLGSDVALPTTHPAGAFVTIDRYQTDVVTQINVPSGDVVGQVRTHNTATVTNFTSNPADWAQRSATSAWVSRYGVNTNPDAALINQGDDLIEINPSTMERTGNRIRLDTLHVTIDETLVYARPLKIVPRGEFLVVGLDRISLDYSVYGPGAVAIIDMRNITDTTDITVTEFPLGALKNCGRIVPLPEDNTRVMVSCIGDYSEETRNQAGVVVLHIDDYGNVTQEAEWTPANNASSALAIMGVTPLSATEYLAIVPGNIDPATNTNDKLYKINITTGEQTLVFENAGGAYKIGTAAYDPATGLLLVPDASTGTGGLHRMQVTIDTENSNSNSINNISITHTDTLQLAPSLGLPPRSVQRLR